MAQRLWTLYACMFVLMIGYGITLPVLPFHIERLALSQGATSVSVAIHVGVMTATALYLILAYVAILALGMGLLVPSLASLVTKSSESHFGAALGIQSAAYSLGQGLGPVIGGVLLNISIHLPLSNKS